jgi:hypothetical protein
MGILLKDAWYGHALPSKALTRQRLGRNFLLLER